MTPWIYTKADQAFKMLYQSAILFLVLLAITIITKPVSPLILAIMVIATVVTFVILAIAIRFYAKYSAIEKKANRDLAKLKLKQVNSYDTCVVQSADSALSYIRYKDQHYTYNGLEEGYQLFTIDISPDVKWYQILFIPANAENNFHVICERTKSQNIISVFKPF